MSKILANREKEEIYQQIREFLAEELDADLEKITADARIIDDLGGDSLIFLELVEKFKKQYNINLEVRTIGQYLLKKSISTIKETANAIYDIIEKGESLIEAVVI